MCAGGGHGWRPWETDAQLLKLVMETWNVTFLVGKEFELVWEVERYWLDIVRLT